MAPGFGRAEDRLHAALAEVYASGKVRAVLRRALMRYYRAMDTFDRLPAPPGEVSAEMAGRLWEQMPPVAKELEECAETLTGAIEPDLEAAEREWEAAWAVNNPLARMEKLGEKLRRELADDA